MIFILILINFERRDHPKRPDNNPDVYFLRHLRFLREIKISDFCENYFLGIAPSTAFK